MPATTLETSAKRHGPLNDAELSMSRNVPECPTLAPDARPSLTEPNAGTASIDRNVAWPHNMQPLVASWSDILTHHVDRSTAGGDDWLSRVPARWCVCLLIDVDGGALQLLCAKNLRAMLKRRLGAPRSRRVGAAQQAGRLSRSSAHDRVATRRQRTGDGSGLHRGRPARVSGSLATPDSGAHRVFRRV